MGGGVGGGGVCFCFAVFNTARDPWLQTSHLLFGSWKHLLALTQEPNLSLKTVLLLQSCILFLQLHPCILQRQIFAATIMCLHLQTYTVHRRFVFASASVYLVVTNIYSYGFVFTSANIHFQLRLRVYIYKHTLSATVACLHLQTYTFSYGSVFTSVSMDALCTLTYIFSYDSFVCICTLQQQIFASTILFATAKMHSEVIHICRYNPVFA